MGDRGVSVPLLLVLCASMLHGAPRNVHHRPPVGHLEPLGQQIQDSKPVNSYKGFVTPDVFFNEYVRHSQPAVFQAAAMDIPAFSTWTDSFMKSEFVGMAAPVEVGLKERAESKKAKISMELFIDMYTEKPIKLKKLVNGQMRQHLSMPRMYQCGGFQHMLDSVDVHMHMGNTSSTFKRQDLDSLICFLDGSASYIIYHREVEPEPDSSNWDWENDASEVDPDAVDLEKYPMFAQFPDQMSTSLNKGDCIFMPMGSFLHERTAVGRTLSVELHSVPRMWYNESDCLTRHIPTASTDSLIKYKVQALDGRDDLESTRFSKFQQMDSFDQIYPENLMEHWNVKKEIVDPIMEFCDKNQDGILQWSEVYETDIRQFADRFPEIDEEEIFKRVHSDDVIDYHNHEEGTPKHGHMEPLGHQRDTGGHVEADPIFMRSEHFFYRYVQVMTPVMLTDYISPSMDTWTDEFLSSELGNETVTVVKGRKETFPIHVQEESFSEFLSSYQTRNVRLETLMPYQLDADVVVPRCLACGGINHLMLDPTLHMCSGWQCKTALTHNSHEGVYCLLDGDKTRFYIPDRDRLPFELTDMSVNEIREGKLPVDVDAVDTVKFPFFSKLPWQEAVLGKRDCIYLPEDTYFYMAHSGQRNMMLKFRFMRPMHWTEDDCKEIDSTKKIGVLMNKLDPLSEPEMILNEAKRFEIFHVFERQEEVTVNDMVSRWWMPKYKVLQVLEAMDEDDDGKLSWPEIYAADMHSLIERYPFIQRVEWETNVPKYRDEL